VVESIRAIRSLWKNCRGATARCWSASAGCTPSNRFRTDPWSAYPNCLTARGKISRASGEAAPRGIKIERIKGHYDHPAVHRFIERFGYPAFADFVKRERFK